MSRSSRLIIAAWRLRRASSSSVSEDSFAGSRVRDFARAARMVGSVRLFLRLERTERVEGSSLK